MATQNVTRRSVLAAGAAAAAVFATPFVRGAHAAGKLTVGFWDHWVPGANDVMRRIVQEWADKEKVDTDVDFITSTGDKIRITIAAEAQAGSGHDVLAMSTWLPASYADKLEPVDDVVNPLIEKSGDIGKTVRPGPGQRALDRGADRRRDADQAALRPHRSSQGACRPRHHPDVPGRRSAQ